MLSLYSVGPDDLRPLQVVHAGSCGVVVVLDHQPAVGGPQTFVVEEP